jgi:hypothetical protein
MTKENVIASVQSSLGSLFTKDDVITCINMVEETPQPQPKPQQDLQAFIRDVKDRVLEMIDTIDWRDSNSIEVSDIEYEIRHGNCIEVDTFDVDASILHGMVQDGIEEIFNDLWAEHQMRIEIVNENN